MYSRKYGILSVLLVYAVLSAPVFVISCSGLSKENGPSFDSQLSAENSMMKKRLPLIERENDVLKKENQQHRATIFDLESQIQRLNLELTALREKYTNDMAGAAEQISSLQDAMQKNQSDNAEKIEALDALNKSLEKKLNREIHNLNEKMTRQKAAFDRERTQINAEHAKKQSNLTSQLERLQKTIEPKDLEISSLKRAIAEISVQLGEATTASKAMKKARDDAQADLEAAKAANAELIKKMDALNHELSMQNKPSGTNR